MVACPSRAHAGLDPSSIFGTSTVIREVLAAGWECHLEAAEGSEACVRAQNHLQCPRCAESRGGLVRPPAILGLHPLERAGAWTPAPLEARDLPDDAVFTDQELRDWLGPQAAHFDQALVQGLSFLEVYAGKARATEAVRAHGRIAICLGLDHGQDFRLARDRALVKRLKPLGLFPLWSFLCLDSVGHTSQLRYGPSSQRRPASLKLCPLFRATSS